MPKPLPEPLGGGFELWVFKSIRRTTPNPQTTESLLVWGQGVTKQMPEIPQRKVSGFVSSSKEMTECRSTWDCSVPPVSQCEDVSVTCECLGAGYSGHSQRK